VWAATEIPSFGRESLAALAAAEVPAVRLARFGSPTEVRTLCDLLLAEAVRTHSIEEVTRLGISQFEQGVRGSKEAYFRQAQSLVPSFESVFARSFNPVVRLIGELRRAGIEADVMTEPGFGAYWAGNGKLRYGATPIHVDFAPQDSAGWAVGETRVQLAWNVYLDNPGGGGDLHVWERCWSQEDDVTHKVEGEFYYRTEVVRGARRVDVPVAVGDVVIVNSVLYHAVAEATGRMAFGSFISIFDDGRFRLWS
jgi:hypothetical protein